MKEDIATDLSFNPLLRAGSHETTHLIINVHANYVKHTLLTSLVRVSPCTKVGPFFDIDRP